MAFQARGKGFSEIEREAIHLLALAITTDGKTGKQTLTRDAVFNVLDQVDDGERFREPMANALLDLILTRNATIIFPPKGGPSSGSA